MSWQFRTNLYLY